MMERTVSWKVYSLWRDNSICGFQRQAAAFLDAPRKIAPKAENFLSLNFLTSVLPLNGGRMVSGLFHLSILLELRLQWPCLSGGSRVLHLKHHYHILLIPSVSYRFKHS